MKKDFQRWHGKKSQIDEIEKRPFFNQQEIWFCHLGANVGFEQDGRGDEFLRPVLVFRKFNNEVFWGVPLTKTKKNSKFYFNFSFMPGVESAAVLSQMRLIDGRRLARRVGYLPKGKFQELIIKLKELFP